MDPLGVASTTISIVSFAVELVGAYRRNIIPQFYGQKAGLQRVVLWGGDEEALRFRDSVINECNMTAVAGAIIAQVALTALSLANLSLAHWTARAFLLFATVSGCLSVYYACSLSRDIGKLYQPEFIRDWLSAESAPEQIEQGGKKERKVSISAIFILSAPYTMMSYAITAFVLGLAIYQGFVWTRNLDTGAGKINSRNIFIAYIASSGFGVIFFSFAAVIKYWENQLLLRNKTKTKMGGSARYSQRDGESSSEPEIYPSTTPAEKVAAPPQNIHTASQSQDTAKENSSGGIAAALEAAAKAHILSAEADRRAAMEYAKLSKS